jgi:hypothetical protein
MREAKRHESTSQANMGKFYDTNAPGIRLIHRFGETSSVKAKALLLDLVRRFHSSFLFERMETSTSRCLMLRKTSDQRTRSPEGASSYE